MSRMRKSKNIKKSNLKSTITGFALAIAIGTVGGVGSYAWFTDRVELNNDLVVTTGNLSTDISDGFKAGNKLTPNNQITKNITITNTGSLKQKARLYIDVTNINHNDKALLSVTINELNNTTVDPNNPTNTFNLSHDNSNKYIDLGTIDSGGTVQKTVIVKSYDNQFTGDKLEFNFRAESEQINKE